MYVPISFHSSSHHLHLQYCSLIIFFVIIITSSPPVNGQNLDLFSTCRDILYNCGRIRGVGYPFWGRDRPKECGHPSFGLKCDEKTNHTTMEINSLSFRVLDIGIPNKYAMRIARSDFLDNFCPNRSISDQTKLIEGMIEYFPYVESVTLRFSCDSLSGVPQDYLRYTFKCEENGVERLGFLQDGDDDDVFGPYKERCTAEVKVPVPVIGLQELRGNDSKELLEVLNQGIVVLYNGSYDYCSVCETSHGICWSETSRSEQPTCLCRDKVYNYYCGFQPEGKSIVGWKIGIGTGAAALSAVIICTILFLYRRTKKRYHYVNKHEWRGSGNLEVFMEQYGSLALKVYSYSDIKKMSNSFKHKLGRGGFGEVYRGHLCDGRPVAVKILNSTKGNGEEFINEVASISRTSHVNVVNLLGFCYRGPKRALVYELMPNGSLEKYIHGNSENTHLGWDKLHEIALGIARGLEYLHKGCNTRILHFDIKPHNILLDQDFYPKISDFGLAKLCNNKESAVSLFGARGTIGYIAPELVSRNFGNVSHKSDVYSYGMMVLEMVGGRKNVNDNASHSSQVYFPHWAYHRVLLDEDLKLQGIKTEEEEEIAKKMILVGFWCIQMDPSDRPPMDKVIEMLVGSLEKLEIPPKPFLYSSSHSEGISPAITPALPLASSESPSFSMNIIAS